MTTCTHCGAQYHADMEPTCPVCSGSVPVVSAELQPSDAALLASLALPFRSALVRCERCGAEWTAIPKKYPSDDRQSSHYCAAGDWCIDCPRCMRGYFVNDAGDFYADRLLTILKVLE